MNFANPEYLLHGSPEQIRAGKILRHLEVFERLAAYKPLLAGTYPLDLTTAESDLDILCEVGDHETFSEDLRHFYGDCEGFTLKDKMIRGRKSTIGRIVHSGITLEFFGQNQPAASQDAYLHLLVEWHLMQTRLRYHKEDLLSLKQKGYSTEEAFAKLLKIDGDPYAELLLLGRSLGVYD